MVEGRDFCVVTPPPSKADQFGMAWGNDPIWLPYHPSDEICAALHLRNLELHWPIYDEATRRKTPLFTGENKKTMFVRPWLAKQTCAREHS
eukprot:3879996-Prymnesium_polylepis.1